MKPPQIIVGGDFAFLQDFQEMFRPRFDQMLVPDQIKRFVRHSALGTGSVAAGFRFDELGHDVAPSALDETRIGRRQIGLGNLEVDGRLLMRLIASVEKPLSLPLVTGLKTFLPAGFVVLDEKDSSASLEQAIFVFHRHPNF
ncbi:MAG TPA: hypothetical protein VG077_16905 [Verrucomicrobiae bacterium]|nr:hypothetical protein [Verrucomicrobiae bacterium]